MVTCNYPTKITFRIPVDYALGGVFVLEHREQDSQVPPMESRPLIQIPR